MADAPSNSIFHFGDLTKPMNTLIEKCSNAIVGVARPSQIIRVAEAQAKAKQIKAISDIETRGIQRRMIMRLIGEETIKQGNMESVLEKALPLLTEEAKPENINNDWITYFFDKAKLTSDSQVQDFWAKLLAGEANTPGSFSKRTILTISYLAMEDAFLFNALCRFIVKINEHYVPMVRFVNAEIYKNNGINSGLLFNLDSLGFIRFDAFNGFRLNMPENIKVSYFNKSAEIKFFDDTKIKGLNVRGLNVGQVILTGIGVELYKLCNPSPVEGLIDYIREEWRREGMNVEFT